MKRIIVRVYEIKQTEQKLVTVPKHCGIKAGDFVELKKVTIK